ncbi:hypothetical protein VQ045_06740 [Aurantimonas sp. E1-2-R+4]|uniref:hypothetical protein n=1 Tax=Aurantimonas sp. E1-2-R+4 TaxID=3113714 RepID=UPI002F953B7C
MSDDKRNTVEVAFDDRTFRRLVACAEWRKVPVPELVRAYAEDWVDIDYPESRGRHTRRATYRDGPIGLCEGTRQEASRNWIKDLGEEAP